MPGLWNTSPKRYSTGEPIFRHQVLFIYQVLGLNYIPAALLEFTDNPVCSLFFLSPRIVLLLILCCVIILLQFTIFYFVQWALNICGGLVSQSWHFWQVQDRLSF